MKLTDRIIQITIVTTLILTVACSKDQEELPNASFVVSPDIARVADTIYFQNTSEGINEFEWDFGDGNSSTEENPWHTYSEIGTYSVILKVTNTAGSDESLKGVRISNWSTRSKIPTKRGMHSSCVLDGKIYVIGGSSKYGQGELDAVEVYNPETDTWSARSDISTARQSLTANTVDGKIYTIGGAIAGNPNHYRDSEIYTVVEEYDPATDSWSTKSPMPSARYVNSAAVLNNKIYIIGGSVNFPWEGILTMDMYNPATDSWSSVGSIPRPMIGNSTAVVNGKIYVLSGEMENTGNRLDEYDPETNTWTRKADIPTNRNSISCCVLDGKIYAIGGEDSETHVNLNTVEVYDPVTDTWTEADPLLFPRWVHSSCVVNGRIYVIGGFTGLTAFDEVEVYYE